MRNTQLFVSKGKLVVIGSKSSPYGTYYSSMIARDQKIAIIIYDVTNPKAPKLTNAYEYEGYLQESRLIDGMLTMVTSQSLTWGPVYTMREKVMAQTNTQTIDADDFTFTARELLPTWVAMKPTTITRNGVQKVTTAKTTTPVDCTNLFYNKPSTAGKNSMWGQSLTSIITFSLDKPTSLPTIKTVLSNTSQVHVTKNTLYITTPGYVASPMRCPLNARCMMPMWSQGNHTAIHQFSLPALKYNYSTAVKGSTYNQYSMDDTNGNFRIVTSDWEGNINKTNVYTVNAEGKVVGKLE